MLFYRFFFANIIKSSIDRAVSLVGSADETALLKYPKSPFKNPMTENLASSLNLLWLQKISDVNSDVIAQLLFSSFLVLMEKETTH